MYFRTSLLVSMSCCLLLGCQKEPGEAGQQEAAPQTETVEAAGAQVGDIEAAQAQLTDSVLGLPGVVGTGIGECEGKPCLTVLVVEETPDLRSRIPETFAGYPVAVQVTGEIRAQDEPEP